MLDAALATHFEAKSRRAARALLWNASASPKALDVRRWVERNLRVPDGPHEGTLYQSSETPFWAEVFDCLSDANLCTRVSVKKSAQVGFTLCLMGWQAALMAVKSSRQMIVMPTINAARDFSDEKLEPLIEKTRALTGRVLPTKQKSGEGSTALVKKFPGGSCRLTGANSSADLRSKTVQFIGVDEIDEFPFDLGEQGDPMGMIDARQFAFHASGNYKKLEGSTPTIKGQSRIDLAYEEGDQREYHVPCPHCGFAQALVWERLGYSDTYPHKAEYQCIECHEWIGHHEKKRMMQAGRWVAQAPGPGRHPSFAINALYSPFVSWDKMVEAYFAAKDDPLKLKAWWNLWKGESFEVKGEAPGWKELKERVDGIALYELGTVPDEALFLTAGVDVQGNRIEIVIVGWGIGATSYVIDRLVLIGETNGLEVWTQLTEVLNRTWVTRSGYERRIEMMAIDAGFRPTMVFNWVRGKEAAPRGLPRAMAIRGATKRTNWVLGGSQKQSFSLSGSKSKKGTTMCWWVGSFAGKIHLYGRLGLKGPNEAGQFPLGFCHMPVGLADDFYQQAVSEILVPVARRSGLLDYEWRLPPNTRNEVLDCLVYAYAAAEALDMHKMSPAAWEQLAEERAACAPSKGQLDMLAAVIAPASDADPGLKKESVSSRLAKLNREN